MFEYFAPVGAIQPILVSSPHSGEFIPPELHKNYAAGVVTSVIDTDWHVDQVYGFVPAMGIGLVKANLSRYVVDLNRAKACTRLYDDGRTETGIVPLVSFAGKKLYKKDHEPTKHEIEARVAKYYCPYHEELIRKLKELKRDNKYVLLFDAHSILSQVPSIQKEKFPELILGNDDGRTCPPEIMQWMEEGLGSEGYQVSRNHPFKGGAITREQCRPEEGIFSIQLEMIQDLYMDETNRKLDAKKVKKLQRALRCGLGKVIKGMESLK